MLDLINARKRDDGLTAETAVAGSHTVARAGVTQPLHPPLQQPHAHTSTHTRTPHLQR